LVMPQSPRDLLDRKMTGEKSFIRVRDGRALKQAKTTISTMMGWGAKKWKCVTSLSKHNCMIKGLISLPWTVREILCAIKIIELT
jgi:hypothetical protein